MGALPPGALILLVAALSALAGGVLTGLIFYATDAGRRDTPDRPSDQTETRTKDMLRVVQTNSGPAVLVRGQRKRHLREIGDRQTGEEAVAAVRAVLAFAEGWLPALQERGVPSATSGPAPHPAASRVSSSSSPVFANSGPEDPSTSSPSQTLNLFEEIDTLLQRRVVERPDLATRGIRLTEDLDGGLLIYVGRERYHSTADIPDDAVRGFIRETIRMWENQ